MPETFSFIIRFIHVISVGLLLGGSVLLWWLTVKFESAVGGDFRVFLIAAEKYEWIFWAATGFLAMTGIGNLGAFGAGLPNHNSAWGIKLDLKLLLLLVLILFSLLRTFVLSQFVGGKPREMTNAGRRIVSSFYAGTSILLLFLVSLAVSLAHGH